MCAEELDLLSSSFPGILSFYGEPRCPHANIYSINDSSVKQVRSGWSGNSCFLVFSLYFILLTPYIEQPNTSRYKFNYCVI